MLYLLTFSHSNCTQKLELDIHTVNCFSVKAETFHLLKNQKVKSSLHLHSFVSEKPNNYQYLNIKTFKLLGVLKSILALK